ncbi:MAG: FmdB family transcriptional regulator [Ignavibacteriales bacterium CG_4_9_14_3_um_filter_30_11]|nr:MAG: FmdB family transcriptional regulator [Ignavibacteriales bacterium CG12_big_fil_rev_8_21_14_0_65_30_8]PJA98043.1 MAG: FmdB family transcriptional regulator [Ignavibacteriales bacterium CG_4_9_14_3_um_filter_30_11]
MPTYEYRCNKCYKRFELFQKMSDKPIENCPECNGNVTKIISAGMGVIFKGTGFYQTDYKNNNSKDSAKADSSNKSTNSDSKETTKKETSKETKKSKED